MADTLGIGSLIVTQQSRDAIHVAIIPVVAGDKIHPAQRIGVDHGIAFPFPGHDQCVGIADPFLLKDINAGERFWMFLLPNTVTSIRHDWYHPSFPVESTDSAAKESNAWLADFAAMNRIEFNDLIESIADGHVCFGDNDGPSNAQDEINELRRHYRNATGLDAPSDILFRCGC